MCFRKKKEIILESGYYYIGDLYYTITGKPASKKWEEKLLKKFYKKNRQLAKLKKIKCQGIKLYAFSPNNNLLLYSKKEVINEIVLETKVICILNLTKYGKHKLFPFSSLSTENFPNSGFIYLNEDTTITEKENGDIIIGNYSIKEKTKRRTRRKKKNEIN
ncbi:MAG TPA: hypothetical protein PLE44_01020 [Bacilli bacterium]|nr:hypothetical protein [Bacilli bacterium]HOR53126.1 hypothetical protein [Bacilli bacterium]HPL58667.1 hypothetical protein [Bacilli bacterium]